MSTNPHNNNNNSSNNNSNNNNTRWTNPMHSMHWICADLLITGSQLTACIAVLLIQRHHERLQAPNLYKWILGYVGGCIAHVMAITWRFFYRNSHRSSPARHAPPRLSLLVDYVSLLLHMYYAGWYVMGGIWMSAEYTSAATDAPSLYRLSMVLLIFCFIGYAMPLIFCGVFFFCSPFVVLVEEMFHVGYARRRSIRSLPTFKFEESQADIEPEDAVCVICLENYDRSDEVKRLPCNHMFHKGCADRWLNRNTKCPLCKEKIPVVRLMRRLRR